MQSPESDAASTVRERSITSRRSFLACAGMGVVGATMLSTAPALGRGSLRHGDAAILRFLAAAEILETDLWRQYNELCGIQDGEVPGGSGNKAFTEAVKVLDGDMDQSVHDNTEDEHTHFAFINAYLSSRGAQRVNLDQFRTSPFLSRKFPVCSIVRPTATHGAAMGALQFLTAMGLFRGQSPAFFTTLTTLAREADAARRR